jgi:hypothetical protein
MQYSNRNNFNVTLIFVSIISYKRTFPSVTAKSIPWCLIYMWVSRWLHAHSKAHANLSAVFKVA